MFFKRLLVIVFIILGFFISQFNKQIASGSKWELTAQITFWCLGKAIQVIFLFWPKIKNSDLTLIYSS